MKNNNYKKELLKISIVTVVLNDVTNIRKTILSVINQMKFNSNIEYIIVDGGSSDGTIKIIEEFKNFIDFIIIEPDEGIYDAMNKGLSCVTGHGVIFLNSGDFFCGNVLGNISVIPLFLPVKYKNFFGKIQSVPIRSSKSALPNCHQGILFERTTLKYDLKYNISSDYDYYLKHGYRDNVKMHLCEGHIYFSPGYSVSNYKKRDEEILEIRIKYFGLVIGYFFEAQPLLKRFLRKLHNYVQAYICRIKK
jgi:glycosyltransferase involved in cell wall biosynthesis